MKFGFWVVSAVVLCGCGKDHVQPVKAASPAKVENQGVREADLARITLTPEAVRRLGIEVAEVELKETRPMRIYAAEALVPPGQTVTISAPLQGFLHFQAAMTPGKIVHAGEVMYRVAAITLSRRDAHDSMADSTVALSQVQILRGIYEDLQRRQREGGVSAGAVEAARANLAKAEATLSGSLQPQYTVLNEGGTGYDIPSPKAGMVRQILAGPGQYVTIGTPVVQIAPIDPVWLRVAVYSGELDRIARNVSAEVRPIGDGPRARPRMAKPIPGPSTADPLASTSDLYYEAPNADLSLQPGERVNISLPFAGAQKRVQAPWSGIVYDVNGGSWIYEAASPTVFIRRRVEVDYTAGSTAILSNGPKPGTRVVSAGAAELFGTEFGAGK